jgi:hypothetical protein
MRRNLRGTSVRWNCVCQKVEIQCMQKYAPFAIGRHSSCMAIGMGGL